MARRKKHHKKPHRRRMGATGKNTDLIMEGAGLILTLAYGSKLTAMIPASLPTVAVGGVETVGGFFLAKKSKNPLLRGVGLGFMATGGVTMLKSFGVAGIGGGPLQPALIGMTNGFPAMQAIGSSQADMMTGINQELQSISGADGLLDQDIDEDYD